MPVSLGSPRLRRTPPLLGIALVASIFAVAAPSAALAHPPALTTVKGHLEEDTVNHGPAEERRLERRTMVATARDAEAAAAAVTGNEHEVGQWGPVVDWPVVGVHVALLENGKVLAYDSVGDYAPSSYPVHDHTRATVWDPATGTFTPVDLTGYNVFCSGLAHLLDGSLFLAGGNKNDQLEGIAQTHVFDSDTNTWSRGADMAEDRWYPTVTPLHDGELLITAGGPEVPEVRQTDGALRALDTAALSLPLYPWIDVAPDGRAFYSGPEPTLRSLDPAGGGSWQTFGRRDSLWRGYGSHVMYDRGRILVAGGQLSSRDSRVINLNGATPQTSSTERMGYGRRQHNLTVLADGKVLATGGLSSGAELVDVNNGVYPAELWNPATGRWRTLAAMQVTRQYHSTALLLPDARVLSSGGGVCGACDAQGYLAKNAEVFSPPYLFKNDDSGELAPRPEITSAPDEITYDSPFSVSTPALTTVDQNQIRQKRQEVENALNQSGTNVAASTDVGAGSQRGSLSAGDWIELNGPFNLLNIDSITFRVTGGAPDAPSGTVEVWRDAINAAGGGTLVSSHVINGTAAGTYASRTFPIVSPGGSHRLFLVFANANTYSLNWVEFVGAGVGS